jgi:predicted metal-dependent hydrolase
MGENTALQSEMPLLATPESGPVIELDGRRISYTLQRTRRRRTISLLIDERGLRVAAPLKAPQRAIDDLLRLHASWVIRKFHDWQQKRPPPLSWVTGAQIMLYGAPVMLEARAGIVLPQLEQDRLLFNPQLEPVAIESGVRNWLKQQALACFTRCCRDYSAQLELPAPAVRLSNARAGAAAMPTAASA